MKIYSLNLIISFILILHLCFVSTTTITATSSQALESVTFSANNENIVFFGRVSKDKSFDWSAVGFTTEFTGSSIDASFNDSGNFYDVIIDGNSYPTFTASGNNATYSLATGLEDTKHTLRVSKRTEAKIGIAQLLSLTVTGSNPTLSKPSSASPQIYNPSPRRLEFIGDSITCGFGIEGKPPCSFSPDTENADQAYGVLASEKLNAEYQIISWSGRGLVRNYNAPTPTSPSGTLPELYNRTLGSESTPTWDFQSWVPSAVVINLGTNDFSTQPNPPQDTFENTYQKFLQDIRNYYQQPAMPFFLVCGPMISAPCCTYVQNVVDAEQNRKNKVFYVDLENVLSDQTDWGCDGHPSVSGQQKMASQTISVISTVLNWS